MEIFHWPAKNLIKSIPLVLILGIITGNLIDTSPLKDYILIITILMIYPTMIGVNYKSIFALTHGKVILLSVILNFLLIPLLAYGLGITFLSREPDFLAGLVLAALLPTSGMTISWTMLFKGNVEAAVKITTLSLIIGSFLAPLYLKVLVGALVPIDITKTFITIATVVFMPMILGFLTFKALRNRYSQEEYTKKLKPLFPSFSVWAMLLLIFISISMRSKAITQDFNLILSLFIVLILFYLLNFVISTMVARWLLMREDAIALVYGTVMRNLSLALGVAVTTFGLKAALIVTLAFIIQVQGAAWYGKIAEKRQWLG